VARRDYTYPFSIGPSGQANEADYKTHVRQMVRQVLLTDPGERIDQPDFGCGLRRMIFAPHDPNLDATVAMFVQQSLKRWLGDQIDVVRVTIEPPEVSGDEALLVLEVEYLVLDTQTRDTTRVQVL
jgi:phage baseplate assembly protein W